ncbi:hypothetical protein VNO77_05677 [Canavalia gladiata]|uniref:Uncharacterized protein n=1 Tax=Canavalia gladiata TaxID=3824 RepID=A0AAN9R8X5_CANGL
MYHLGWKTRTLNLTSLKGKPTQLRYFGAHWLSLIHSYSRFRRRRLTSQGIWCVPTLRFLLGKKLAHLESVKLYPGESQQLFEGGSSDPHPPFWLQIENAMQFFKEQVRCLEV